MSVNAKNDIANHYYSGQGVAMIGTRDPNTGLAQALLPLGQVSELKILIASSVIDHKGSQDGQRAIDKRLQTETKCTATITLENWIGKNLALAVRGGNTNVSAGTVTSLSMNAWGGGAVNPLPYVNVAGLGVTQATVGWVSGSMTEYTNDSTPWDYKWNADAGSFRLNSGTELVQPAKCACAIGGTATGTISGGILTISTCSLTLTSLAVGDTISLWGMTGTAATVATVQGVAGVVTAVTGTGPFTGFAVAIPGAAGSGLTVSSALVCPIKQASTGLPFVQSVQVTYTYTGQVIVDSLTQAPQEFFMRFEGLNTAETINGNFAPVVVEVFRLAADPLKELALISDAFGQFVLEGAVLADAYRASGTSKYFSVKKLN